MFWIGLMMEHAKALNVVELWRMGKRGLGVAVYQRDWLKVVPPDFSFCPKERLMAQVDRDNWIVWVECAKKQWLVSTAPNQSNSFLIREGMTNISKFDVV